MQDSDIVALYWQRDERAIAETDRKYGGLCRTIAMNLLGVREDAEECVNDTWLEAWNSMPEQRPERLQAWLGRVVRNLSISRWRRDHRQKRYAGLALLLTSWTTASPPRTTRKKRSKRPSSAPSSTRGCARFPMKIRRFFSAGTGTESRSRFWQRSAGSRPERSRSGCTASVSASE